MMRFAGKKDMPRIMAIWQEGFGDTQDEIEDFFCSCGDLLRICVWEESEQIVSQLILLPVTIRRPGMEALRAEYVYALATERTWHGKGSASKLLCKVKELLQAENKAGILVPAVKELETFYQNRGFSKCFSEKKIAMTDLSSNIMTTNMTYVSIMGNALNLKDISAVEYQRIRREAFCNTVFVDLPLQMLLYAVAGVRKAGGKCLRFTYREKNYGVLYARAGDTLIVEEITTATTEEAMEVCRELLRRLGEAGVTCIKIRRSYAAYGVGLSHELFQNGVFNFVLD